MQVKLILILIAAFAINGFAQTGRDDASIQAVIQKLVSAQTNYDQKTLDAILSADYIEISPLGEFDPRDKVLGFYGPEQKPDPTKMTATIEVTDYSIRSYGSFAIVIARFNYSMNSDGKPLPPRSIRATIVLRKDKADWKIASAHYTGIRPTAPQQKTN